MKPKTAKYSAGKNYIWTVKMFQLSEKSKKFQNFYGLCILRSRIFTITVCPKQVGMATFPGETCPVYTGADSSGWTSDGCAPSRHCFLCCAGAARASDVLRLRRKELVIRSDSSIQVHWTKTKSDPYQLGRFSGAVLRRPVFLLFICPPSLPKTKCSLFTTLVISRTYHLPALLSHSL